jgi:AcrR family transcriptional regulator
MKDRVGSPATRDAILDAADRLLARKGYKKMTIDDIASEVGIGKGSVYVHFRSKVDIALSRIDRTIQRLQKLLEEISRSDGNCSERIKLMLIERVMYRFDAVQHFTQSINDLFAAVRPGLLERRKAHFKAESRIFAAVLDEGKRNGEFAHSDSRGVAVSFLLATNSLLPYSLNTHELGARGEIKRRAARIADLLLNGIVAR